jgi:hypothetical protein
MKNRNCLEFDTSYKRVKDSDQLELTFAAMLEDYGKSKSFLNLFQTCY